MNHLLRSVLSRGSRGLNVPRRFSSGYGIPSDGERLERMNRRSSYLCGAVVTFYVGLNLFTLMRQIDQEEADRSMTQELRDHQN